MARAGGRAGWGGWPWVGARVRMTGDGRVGEGGLGVGGGGDQRGGAWGGQTGVAGVAVASAPLADDLIASRTALLGLRAIAAVCRPFLFSSRIGLARSGTPTQAEGRLCALTHARLPLAFSPFV